MTAAGFDASRWRGEFAVTQRYAYLDHASLGPMPRRTIDVIARRLREQGEQGSLVHAELHEVAESCRASYADFIGARAEQVGYAANTSAGMSTLAAAIDWRAGDQVIVPAIDFPSAVLPWMTLGARGVEVLRVPCEDGRVLAGELLGACGPRTRLVCASWVQFSSGSVLEVAELGEACRRRGILLVLDGIQAVGVLPIDVAALPIDAMVTHSYKWMLGPQGVGWLYIADGLRDRLRLPAAGARSVTPRASYFDHRLEPLPGAARFETGILPFHLIAGVASSLELLRQAQAMGAHAHVAYLVAHLVEGLQRAGCHVMGGADRRRFQAGIVAFIPPSGQAGHCRQGLLEAGIVTAEREGCVRVAPHFYNTLDEIDALVARVREVG
jgi:selenocysteine lyase/cysteine desulfurase